MKKIFISYDYRDNTKYNKNKINKICHYIIGQGMLPITYHYFFQEYENKNEHMMLELIKNMIGICDEVWIYSKSTQCKLEEKLARELKVKIINLYTNEHITETICKRLMEERKGVNL